MRPGCVPKRMSSPSSLRELVVFSPDKFQHYVSTTEMLLPDGQISMRRPYMIWQRWE